MPESMPESMRATVLTSHLRGRRGRCRCAGATRRGRRRRAVGAGAEPTADDDLLAVGQTGLDLDHAVGGGAGGDRALLGVRGRAVGAHQHGGGAVDGGGHGQGGHLHDVTGRAGHDLGGDRGAHEELVGRPGEGDGDRERGHARAGVGHRADVGDRAGRGGAGGTGGAGPSRVGGRAAVGRVVAAGGRPATREVATAEPAEPARRGRGRGRDREVGRLADGDLARCPRC